MRWVQVSGKISFVRRSGQGLNFELAENGNSVSVKVLHATPAENLLAPGMRVQIKYFRTIFREYYGVAPGENLKHSKTQ